MSDILPHQREYSWTAYTFGPSPESPDVEQFLADSRDAMSSIPDICNNETRVMQLLAKARILVSDQYGPWQEYHMDSWMGGHILIQPNQYTARLKEILRYHESIFIEYETVEDAARQWEAGRLADKEFVILQKEKILSEREEAVTQREHELEERQLLFEQQYTTQGFPRESFDIWLDRITMPSRVSSRISAEKNAEPKHLDSVMVTRPVAGEVAPTHLHSLPVAERRPNISWWNQRKL